MRYRIAQVRYRPIARGRRGVGIFGYVHGLAINSLPFKASAGA
jgi:hypothetical protein